MIRPVIVEIAQLIKRVATPNEIDRVLRRFNRALRLEHALRVAVLILMVYPFTF